MGSDNNFNFSIFAACLASYIFWKQVFKSQWRLMISKNIERLKDLQDGLLPLLWSFLFLYGRFRALIFLTSIFRRTIFLPSVAGFISNRKCGFKKIKGFLFAWKDFRKKEFSFFYCFEDLKISRQPITWGLAKNWDSTKHQLLVSLLCFSSGRTL